MSFAQIIAYLRFHVTLLIIHHSSIETNIKIPFHLSCSDKTSETESNTHTYIHGFKESYAQRRSVKNDMNITVGMTITRCASVLH